VGQADLAARGQGAAGLAGLVAEQAAAFGGLEQAPVDLLVVQGAGGDQVVEVAGGFPQLLVALTPGRGGDSGQLLGECRLPIAWSWQLADRDSDDRGGSVDLAMLQSLPEGCWHPGHRGIQVPAGDPLVGEGQERLIWVLKHPRSVGLPTVAYLRAQAFDLMKQYEAVASPTSLLRQAAERLEQITLLREHAPLGRVQQELWRVETQSATLLGRLTWDVSGQHDHATAARYYDQAIAAASNLKEGWAEAFPRMFQRFLPVYTGDGNPQNGLYLAEQATTRAADGSSQVVAGWSAAFAAEAHALLGAERKARLLLERADFHLSKVTADDPMFGIFGREQLGGFVGACQLRLHDPTGAEAALQESARRLGAGKEKHQAVILADLSTAFVLQDDPEQACAVLHQVIDLVELTGSAAGKRRAFAAGRQLTRWRNEPFVQDVQDRLLALAS
jgi:hypothetical protein